MKRILPLPKTLVREMLVNFMIEDEGYGDITSEILFPVDKQAQARIFTREDCVLAGQCYYQKFSNLKAVRLL